MSNLLVPVDGLEQRTLKQRMTLTRVVTMRIDSASSFLNSLFGAELFAKSGVKPIQKAVQELPEEISFRELKDQLGKLASKIGYIKQRGLSVALRTPGQTASSTETVTNPDGTTTTQTQQQQLSRSLTITTNSSDRKFEQEIFKAFEHGYSSGDERLLRSKRVAGEVSFTVGDGDDAVNFDISVDGETTAEEFVNEFNAKAGSRAAASLKNTGTEEAPVYKIAVDTTIKTPETPEEPVNPVVLGEGKFSPARLEAEGQILASDIRSFVNTFNQTVKSVKSSENGLAVNKDLLDSLSSALESAKSDDGTVSVKSFLSERADGTLNFQADKFVKAFTENPEAVVQSLHSLAAGVGGSKGVVEQYAAEGGKLDQVAGDYRRAIEEKLRQSEQAQAAALQGNTDEANKIQGLYDRLVSGAQYIKGLL